MNSTAIQPTDFFNLILIGVLVMIALALALVLFFYRSQQKLLQEKMQQHILALQHQEALLFSTIKTQEKERERIAKDLHDEVGSKLNVIFMNMHRLRKKTKTSEEVVPIINDINGLIHTTIDTTRRISHDLLPPTLSDFGLIAAIQELVESYNKTDLKIEMDDSEVDNRLEDKMIELNVFRVIQELIKNSIIHGESQNIYLKIGIHSALFNIDYQDDGKGFDMSVAKKRKGLGTQNIESRLKMSNAEIHYDSAIGKGVKATIKMKK